MRTLRRWGSSICRVGPGWSARACPDREYPGPPDAGNLHVRWDEGEGSRVRPCSLSTLPANDDPSEIHVLVSFQTGAGLPLFGAGPPQARR